MRSLIALLVFAVSFSSQAADWRPVKTTPTQNSVDIVDGPQKLNLLWPSIVVHGEDLLMTKSTSQTYGFTVYKRYIFLGVTGNAMVVGITGAASDTKDGKAESDGSFDKTIYIEKDPHGSYTWTPPELKYLGVVRVTRGMDHPEIYTVGVIKGEAKPISERPAK